MTDIFISYASADRPRARAIAEAIEQRGWSVWWDRKIPFGKKWDEVIEQRLDEARCVIVLWTNASVKSEWVKNEAAEGAKRNALFPVLLEEVKIPLEFRRLQAAKLVEWEPGRSDPVFDQLLSEIAAFLESPEQGSVARPAEGASAGEGPPVEKSAPTREAPQPESRSAPAFEEPAPPPKPAPKIVQQNIQNVRILAGHTKQVRSVAFSQDGKLIASASGGDIVAKLGKGDVRLWRMSDGALLQTLVGHEKPVNAVAFSPDGSLVVSAADKVRWWNPVTGAMLRAADAWTSSLAFSPDGQTMASASGTGWAQNKEVFVWRVADGDLITRLAGHTSGIESVAFSPKGDLIASGSIDKTVRLWRTNDGKLMDTLEHDYIVKSVAFSPDSKTLAACGGSSISFWNLASREQPRRKILPFASSIAFSHDGKLLACAAIDTIYLWQVEGGKLIRRLEFPKGSFLTTIVKSIAFAPDAMSLASGSDDKMVRIWALD